MKECICLSRTGLLEPPFSFSLFNDDKRHYRGLVKAALVPLPFGWQWQWQIDSDFVTVYYHFFQLQPGLGDDDDILVTKLRRPWTPSPRWLRVIDRWSSLFWVFGDCLLSTITLWRLRSRIKFNYQLGLSTIRSFTLLQQLERHFYQLLSDTQTK